jgi:hypothetical protein
MTPTKGAVASAFSKRLMKDDLEYLSSGSAFFKASH